jgi:hypothetical protein
MGCRQGGKRQLDTGDAMSEEPVRVSWDQLQDAFDFVSFGQPGEHQAVFCRRSGKFLMHSDSVDFGDDLDEWPDDVDDDEAYVQIPHKKDLGLGKPLALAFVEEFLADEFDEVRRMFDRRGAYARFKDLLQRKDILDQWYDFEAKATDKALREWCDLHAMAINVAVAAKDG